MAKKDDVLAYQREHYKNGGKAAVRNSYLVKTYGITQGDFEEMYESQQGRCAACGNLFSGDRDCHVDHDHTTGIIRGLLCRGCNTSIGNCKENTNRLRKLADYLDRHNTRSDYVVIQKGIIYD